MWNNFSLPGALRAPLGHFMLKKKDLPVIRMVRELRLRCLSKVVLRAGAPLARALRDKDRECLR